MRLGHLGDVVLTTGVLRHWAQHFGWRFDFLTREEWVGALQGHPDVDTVIGLTQSDFPLPKLTAVFRDLTARYAGCGFIDLHGTLRSRLLSALWKGPVLRYPKFSLERRLFLLSRGKRGGETLRRFSVTQRYAMAAAQYEKNSGLPSRDALLPCIFLQETERLAAQKRLTTLFKDSELATENPRNTQYPLPVALHPYAAHIHKTWPADHWRSLAEYLCAARIPWIVIGRGHPLFPGYPADFTNQTSLRETCALLAQCRVLITGDSGPMHLAGAVDTPVAALFGPTTQEWGFYPAGSRDAVLVRALSCRPCSLHGHEPCPTDGECLVSISPEDVMRVITKISTQSDCIAF